MVGWRGSSRRCRGEISASRAAAIEAISARSASGSFCVARRRTLSAMAVRSLGAKTTVADTMPGQVPSNYIDVPCARHSWFCPMPLIE